MAKIVTSDLFGDPGAFGTAYRPAPPAPIGNAGVGIRSLARGIVPGGGAFAGAIAGGEVGGLVGAPLDPFTFGGSSVVLGLGGSLYGAYKGGQIADEAQTGIADAISGGGFSRQRAADEEAHLLTAFIGENASNLAFLRPSSSLALLPRAFGGIVGGGGEAGRETADGEPLDPWRIGAATAFGAALDTETTPGAFMASRIRAGAGMTAARMGANVSTVHGLADVADPAGAVQEQSSDLADANISPQTRADLAGSRALLAKLGDSRTPDERAGLDVHETDAQAEENNRYGNSLSAQKAHGQALSTAIDQLHSDAPIDVPDASPHEWAPTEIGRDSLHWAVGQQESGGNHLAVSPKGARGPMQVMPATAHDPGYGVAPAKDDSWQEYKRVGDDLLDAYIHHYGDQMLGIAAYNAGPGRVDHWLHSIGDPRAGDISPAEFAARIPIAETRDYVKQVFRRADHAIPDVHGVHPQELTETGPHDLVPGFDEGFDPPPETEGADPFAEPARDTAPTTIGRDEIMAATNSDDGLDLGKAGEWLRGLADDALADNRAVTLVIGDRRIPIVEPGLTDAQGQAWGALPVLSPQPGEAAHLEIGSTSAALDVRPEEPPLPVRQPRRARQRSGPTDALTFLAEKGGIRDDEGHALGKYGRKVAGTGAYRSGRDLQRFIPGIGPLIRKTGMSIDRAGELLHEAGYFGHGERPTEADVIDMLESSRFRKVYTPEDMAALDAAAEMGRPLQASDRFDDPVGKDAAAVTDSGLHDIQVLADTDPDAMFRLDDDEKPQKLADILAEFDDDEKALQAAERCLPVKGGAQ